MSRTPTKLPKGAKKVFTGEIFDVWQWEQPMFDGSTTTFEKLARPDTVQIIATTSDGKILVTDEEQPSKPPFISIPGGRVDDGENVLLAAKRELLEETGYVSEEWELFSSDRPVSKIDWEIFTYIAKKSKRLEAQKLDSGEKIEVKEVSFDEFLQLAYNDNFHAGELKNILYRAGFNETEKNKLKKLLFS